MILNPQPRFSWTNQSAPPGASPPRLEAPAAIRPQLHHQLYHQLHHQLHHQGNSSGLLVVEGTRRQRGREREWLLPAATDRSVKPPGYVTKK